MTWDFTNCTKINQSFLGNTLFFCHFWCQGKDAVFDVFNQRVDTVYYCAVFHENFPWGQISNTCYWQVRNDGFYMSTTNDPVSSSSWTKIHNWGDKQNAYVLNQSNYYTNIVMYFQVPYMLQYS